MTDRQTSGVDFRLINRARLIKLEDQAYAKHDYEVYTKIFFVDMPKYCIPNTHKQ